MHLNRGRLDFRTMNHDLRLVIADQKQVSLGSGNVLFSSIFDVAKRKYILLKMLYLNCILYKQIFVKSEFCPL